MIDPFVVGISLVVGRQDALHFKIIAPFENVQSKSPIEKQVFLSRYTTDDQRFHEPEVLNRGGDLSIF
jgi:hypothetical protein